MMDKYLKVALLAARKACEVLQDGFLKSAKVKDKKSGIIADWVTKYDYLAQKHILEIITTHFPAHNLLSEEGINIGKGSDLQWVIDPLDGTTNFSRGIPNFSSSIALIKKDQILLGVIALPVQNEIYWAMTGQGAFLNRKPIAVSKTKKLLSALVGVAMLRSKPAIALGTKTLKKLMTVPIKPRVFGSIATDLARVASGKLDAVVFNHTKPWDIAAGILLVREAGGKVTHLRGKKFTLEAEQMIASNKYLHKTLLKILK